MFTSPFYTTSSLQPPPQVFTAAWLILYPLIGVSGIFLYKEQPTLGILWLLQLILNILWVPTLFTLKNLTFSLVHLVVILILVIVIFYFANPKVKALWLPYLLWLIFACVIFIDTVIVNTCHLKG